MIECNECGCPYSESLSCCPECGNPTKFSSNQTDLTNCPNCGAPVSNSISCDYCGTTFPKKHLVNQNKNSDSNPDVAAFLGGLVGGLIR